MAFLQGPDLALIGQLTPGIIFRLIELLEFFGSNILPPLAFEYRSRLPLFAPHFVSNAKWQQSRHFEHVPVLLYGRPPVP